VKAFLIALFSVVSYGQIIPSESELRAALQGGGTITFQNSGIITLAVPLRVETDITIDGQDKAIVIDGQSATRLLFVTNAQLTLKNLTLINGRVNGANATVANQSGADADGGAIFATNSVLVIQNCMFSNNVAKGGDALPAVTPAAGGAASGGAISMFGGKLTVANSSFVQNQCEAGEGVGLAPAKGGAIAGRSAEVSISASTLLGNIAKGGKTKDQWQPVSGWPAIGGSGGALYGSGYKTEVLNCNFMTNMARSKGVSWSYGGAISIPGGSLLVSNSTFTANSAVGGDGISGFGDVYGQGFAEGGAVFVETYYDPFLGYFASAQLFNSSFVRNSVLALEGRYGMHEGALGGGASVSVTAVVGCTFFANTGGIGGALAGDGEVGVTNCTVVANQSLTGPIGSRGYYVDLKNTLIAFNRPDAGPAFYPDYINDLGNNLCAGKMSTLTNATSRTQVNPKLSFFGDHGGSTPTFLLLSGSPAIDAGDAQAAAAVDQRGRARFGISADIGAVESAPPFSVFGSVSGKLDASIVITTGTQTLHPDNAGKFEINGIPAGMNSFAFSVNGMFVRPATTNIDVNANFDLNARVFEYHALAYDPDLAAPGFTFAGHSGETWEFSFSSDLTNWTTAYTNSFIADTLFSFPGNGSDKQFVKGRQR
jgi:hypothetical protein